MNALPTSGVRQSCGRVPVELRCVIKDELGVYELEYRRLAGTRLTLRLK